MLLVRGLAPAVSARAPLLLRCRAMSRVGKAAVKLPEGTTISIDSIPPPAGDLLKYPMTPRLWKVKPRPIMHDFGECALVSVSGPRGSVSTKFHSVVQVKVDGDQVMVEPRCGGESKCGRTMWGTARALIANMVRGVTRGYTRELEFVGVGFRGALEGGSRLVCKLGYSHNVVYTLPKRFEGKAAMAMPSQTQLVVSGVDKQAVHEVAAQIRDLKRPEPYKGKGIRYAGEVIKLRPGKKK
jgi:large subunit ribosomal protein L6